jgi:hypothetical protein
MYSRNSRELCVERSSFTGIFRASANLK